MINTQIKPISPEEAETIAENFLSRLKDYLPTIIFGLIVFVVGYFIAKLILFCFGKGLEKSKLDKSSHNFLKTIVKVVLYVVVFVVALSSIGANLSSIVAIIGAAGLAIGLALQNSLSNVAGGFIILFSQPFKKGDYIETCGVSGSVLEISILSTSIVTVDNKIIRIPNGQLSSSTLINYSEEAVRRLDIDFSVGYNNDYKKAIELIKAVINDNDKSILTPEPFVRMTAHGESAVTITARVWVKTEQYFDLKSDLLESVKDIFDENGIDIPYNQLVIHNS